MREAIGQLMTSSFMNENTIPAVAVPYTKKIPALPTAKILIHFNEIIFSQKPFNIKM